MTTHELARQLLAGPDVLACVIGQGSEEGGTVPLKILEVVDAVPLHRRIPPSDAKWVSYMLKDEVANDDEEWQETQQQFGQSVKIARLY